MSRRFRLVKATNPRFPCAPAASRPPLPENPYRRFFTRQRTFEDLTRPPQAPDAERLPRPPK